MAIPDTRELLLAGLYPLLDVDPWALTVTERRELARSMPAEQATWRHALGRAAGHPLGLDFPAFLLATPAFVGVAATVRRIARRTGPGEERRIVERFVSEYAGYLGFEAEPVLAGPDRIAAEAPVARPAPVSI